MLEAASKKLSKVKVVIFLFLIESSTVLNNITSVKYTP